MVTGVRPDMHKGSWGRESGMSRPYCRHAAACLFHALTVGMFVIMLMAHSCDCAAHMVEQGFAPEQSTSPVKNKPAVNIKEVLKNHPGMNRLHLHCPVYKANITM